MTVLPMRRGLAALLLAACATPFAAAVLAEDDSTPFVAPPAVYALADDQGALAMYARYEGMAREVLLRSLPQPAPREPSRLPVFLRAAERGLDDSHVLVIVDQGGAVVRRLRVSEVSPDASAPDPLAPRRLATLDLPTPGVYWLHMEETESLDGLPLRQTPPVAVVFDGLELMLDLRLGTGTLDAARLDAAVWTTGDRPGFAERMRGLLGQERPAVRRKLDEPLFTHPDFVLAGAQCADERSRWHGLAALHAMRYSEQMPEGGWPALFWSRYTRCALDAGLRTLAVEGYLAWQQAGADEPALMRGALDFARVDQARGDRRRAFAVLEGLEGLLPSGDAQIAHKDLLGRTLLSLGRNEDALRLLGEGSHLYISHLTGPEGGSYPEHDFLRINYSVALSRNDQASGSRSALDMVGRLGVSSKLSSAIRDRANVTLGWQLLRIEQGAEAALVFERVSLEGPFSGSALLGRGWAPLIDNGRRLRRSDLPGLNADGMTALPLQAMRRAGIIGCHELRQVAPAQAQDCHDSHWFERARFPETAADRMVEALGYWEALADRDPREAETIEGRLAAADAYLVQGDGERAQEMMLRTVRDLDDMNRRVQAVHEAIAAGWLPAFGGHPGLSSRRPLSDTLTDDARYWLDDWAAAPAPEELLRVRSRLAQLDQRLGPVPDTLPARMQDLDRDTGNRLRGDALEALDIVAERYRAYQVITLHKLARSREAALGISPR